MTDTPPAVTFGEWMPIESAPKDGTRVLLHARHTAHSWPIIVAYWRSGPRGTGWFGGKANHAPDGAFTHWMPLPSPPKD